MAEQKFQDIWKEQCVAARSVRAQHGILSALDYLIGEELLIYAETAVTRPEFARELPRFVAEIREIFSGEEIGHYVNHLERMATIEEEQVGNQDDDELFGPACRQAGAPRTAKGTTHITLAGDSVDRRRSRIFRGCVDLEAAHSGEGSTWWAQ
jgi:hypothetical protein